MMRTGEGGRVPSATAERQAARCPSEGRERPCWTLSSRPRWRSCFLSIPSTSMVRAVLLLCAVVILYILLLSRFLILGVLHVRRLFSRAVGRFLAVLSRRVLAERPLCPLCLCRAERMVVLCYRLGSSPTSSQGRL